MKNLIGWFSGRRKTQLWPSMRESAVTCALSSNNIQFSYTFTPCFFILLSTAFQDKLIHTHEYKAFQFRLSTDSFEPRTLYVVILGHCANFTPNSPLPNLRFQVKGMKCEYEGRKDKEQLGNLCDEAFKIGRLKSLMGSEATNYTAELEQLSSNMLKNLIELAKLVAKPSAGVLEEVRVWVYDFMHVKL